MRVWKLLPLLLVVTLAALAPAQQRDARAKGFLVKPGKEIRIKGEDLVIGFVSVTQDSRCPEGALCMWPGNARAHMTARNSKGDSAEFDLNTNLDPIEYDFGGYTISLGRLTPVPSIHDGLPKQEDYEATIVVAKKSKK